MKKRDRIGWEMLMRLLLEDIEGMERDDAEKGVPFIDFHAVLKDIIPFKPTYSRKIVKRRRKDV